jgi:Rrf2 family transcriptional regulator, cysteine metabolism repressor
MLFSTRSEYGVMMLTDLAQHYGKGARSLSETAAELGLTVAYLEQIAPALRAAGFIESQRGAKGGYVLTQPPENIRMGAVIRALEERKGAKNPLGVMACATFDGNGDACEHEGKCTGPFLWKRVRDAITEALDSTTLADLVPGRRHTLPLINRLNRETVGATTVES